MKPIKPGALLFISFFLLHSSFAQSLQKQTITVAGECGQCKKKIEKSALSAGAVYANWNEKTKQLAITYAPAKSNLLKIETAIAGAGYDTPDVQADDKAYNSLDQCCQYDRSSETSKLKK